MDKVLASYAQNPGFNPSQHKPSMAVHAVIPELGRWRQEDQSEVLRHLPLCSKLEAKREHKDTQRDKEIEREKRVKIH